MGSTSLRQPSFHEKFRKCLRISLTFLFSQVGLMALVIAYSAAGAVLFEWLEADQEIEPRRKILSVRLDCLDRMRRLSLQTNRTEWTERASLLLKEFETEVVKATKLEGYDGKEVDDAERQWSVSGALLYSITVITTIGYGNLAPKTGPGKVVTILYALIGIPLMLLCLSNLGSFMASSFQFAFGKIYCCFWCSSRRCCCCRRTRRRRAMIVVPIQQPVVSSGQQTAACAPSDVIRPEPKSVQLLPLDDLAQLAERDYDTVQQEEGRCVQSPSNNNNNSSEHYVMARLNEDARSLLADCSRYSVDNQQPTTAVVPLSNDDWDKTDDSRAETDGKSQHGAVNTPAQHHQQQQQRVPVSVVMAFLVGYICLGAVVFSAWEEWSYLDGAYFSFITLSTIGFGDLVPGSKVLEQGQTKLVACIVYLVVGLAMIAMSFNLVQEEVISQFQRLGQNMGILDEK